jgi:phage head maturation protease
MSDFQIFMPIAKMDAAKRTVSGYASTPAEDSDNEIVTLDAIKDALPDYLKWRNIREMHKLNAVGVAQQADTDQKGLYLTAKIVDDAAWEKCKAGVYKGFSIGGRKLARNGKKITKIDLTEISVVDRPANPECSFDMVKAAKPVVDAPAVLVKVKDKVSAEAKALAKMAKIVGSLAKNGPPAAHDGFSLPAPVEKTEPAAQPDGVASVNDSRPNENITRKTDDSSSPYGDVEYADPGHQADKKKRYPIDNEDHIRAAWSYINKPKNGAKYNSEHLAGIKSRIVSAWKKHIHQDGPPAAKVKSAKKFAKFARLVAYAEADQLPSFLTLGAKPASAEDDPFTLGKRMSTASNLSYVFDSIRSAQRSLILEGRGEKDSKDRQLADRLGSLAKEVAGVIADKATHEGGEATSLTDIDDAYINQFLNGDNAMTTSSTLALAAGGDPLAAAILDLVKRAAEPSIAKRMEDASEDVKKARKAMKECRKAIEECHKMHKAAYLAKMAKAKGGKADGKDGDDDFDHEGAMEKLNKAFSDAQKAAMLGKAAIGQLAKAAAHVGQRGQETTDAMSGVYEVPAGVKNLSMSDMAGAGTGTGERGTMPSLMPADGSVYAGKAGGGNDDLRKFANKDGMVPLGNVELMMKAAAAEAELAALRRMPMSAVGARRPLAFDPSAVMGGGTFGNGAGGSQDLHKSLFDGVNVNALNGADEMAHTAASARVIGNMLTNTGFAKSVLDPSFKGSAGS